MSKSTYIDTMYIAYIILWLMSKYEYYRYTYDRRSQGPTQNTKREGLQ